MSSLVRLPRLKCMRQSSVHDSGRLELKSFYIWKICDLICACTHQTRPKQISRYWFWKKRSKKRDEKPNECVCEHAVCLLVAQCLTWVQPLGEWNALERVCDARQNSFSQLFFFFRKSCACVQWIEVSRRGCLKRRQPHFLEKLNASMWRCVYAQRAHAFVAWNLCYFCNTTNAVQRSAHI